MNEYVEDALIQAAVCFTAGSVVALVLEDWWRHRRHRGNRRG